MSHLITLHTNGLLFEFMENFVKEWKIDICNVFVTLHNNFISVIDLHYVIKLNKIHVKFKNNLQLYSYVYP
jgi:hypothetical protein